MTGQEQGSILIETIKETNHPFQDWVLTVTNQLNNPFDFDWLLAQQRVLKSLLVVKGTDLSIGSFTKKEVLQEIKGLWEQVRRLYFRDYFLNNVLNTKTHPLHPLLQTLSKGIDSHESYLFIETCWNQQVSDYCLALGDEFSNLARLSLSKFYTAQKNQYYDHILSVEVKTSVQNPFYSFVHFIETNDCFDESLYQVFEEKLSQVETLIADQNEQYQRNLFAVLKPYFMRGKLAYYKVFLGSSSWEMAEADIHRHSHWVASRDFLTKLTSTSIETKKELENLTTALTQSQSAREREMGPFDFAWLQKEFEKRLRFIEKRLPLSTENQFAPWLKQMRESRNLSYRQLEQLSGVSSTYLHRLEVGARRSPSIPVAKKIAEAFNVPFEVVAKFINSEVFPSSETSLASVEEELDLLKLLDVTPFTIGDSVPLGEEKRQILVQLLKLMTNSSFNPNHLPDTMELLDLIQQFRQN